MSPSSWPAQAQAPGLQLAGLQHGGRDVESSWTWPDAADRQGFDRILGAMLERPCAETAGLAAFVLQRLDEGGQPAWWLENLGGRLACAVNARLLHSGSRQRLAAGDEIELGLTRLVVRIGLPEEMAAMAAIAAPALPQSASRLPPELPPDATRHIPVPPPHATPVQAAAAHAADGFDLAALNTPNRLEPRMTPEGLPPAGSDFSDLISFSFEAHDEPAANGPPAGQPARSAGPAAQPVQGAPDKAEGAAPDPDGDPLELLHRQYLARLRDPSHGDAHDAWRGPVRASSSSSVQDDPMQHWQQAAGPGSGLDDLLGQAQNIASVIDRLDTLCTTDLLAPEPFDSVMHLFAPEGLRQQRPDSLQHLVQRSLPGLTRREHHSLSLDSAMPSAGRDDRLAPAGSTATPAASASTHTAATRKPSE